MRDGMAHHSADSGFGKTEIFLRKGLDRWRWNQIDPTQNQVFQNARELAASSLKMPETCRRCGNFGTPAKYSRSLGAHRTTLGSTPVFGMLSWVRILILIFFLQNR